MRNGYQFNCKHIQAAMPRRRKPASEKKRTAQARQERFRAKQVSLDEQIDPWKQMKTVIGVPTDDELAKHFIDW
jgi:hypothetical protein